ncbi:mitotic spindle assembly checkpoint protein MAD2B [Prorops nasuta]|uniref:mitotic spindle assembly checkpoint protein MAD2B n=1 Tax=Prorops nasuta TaxID=863751 RepID=UPI0034CE90E8
MFTPVSRMSQDKIVGSDILLEFLEVAFNQILFFRNLYPKEIFQKKIVYGLVVFICQHPELKEYFLSVLTAIKELITFDEKSIKKVNIVFYNQEKQPIEKFVIDLVSLQKDVTEQDPYYIKTEESLRTLCLKFSGCDSYLKPLPEGSTFSIEIVTYETAHVALSENPVCDDFPWIVDDKPKEMTNKNILPLKTVKTDCLTLQMYVIEDDVNKNI